ncbi:MAG TPA: peptide ABC transporter substrate-binding protein [Candidatus Izemoplasmatales bacterium]|nr:peptide ABC transporter substrate-binding protein [Candidatus Izemoplasmatales bacterium]
MKRLFLVLSAVMFVFVLAACGQTTTTSTTSGTTTSGTTTTTTTQPPVTVLNWNIGAEPQYIDPTLNGASDGGDVISQTFEGLTREKNGIVYPGIAETWEVSSDGLTVTFNLRQSKWSDGSNLTANDFIYGWKRGMNPETASEYAWIWEYTNIVGALEAVYEGGSLDDVGIEAPDDYTLVIHLTQRTEYIVSLLSFYHFMPIKESVVEDDIADGTWAIDPAKVVCNGAFVLTAYTTGDGLVLSKNANYWDAENVKLTQINGKFIDEDASAYYAYLQEELDVIPTVPAAMVPTLVAEDPEFYSFALLGTYYANFNMDDPILSNNKLRLALSYSINREEICETLAGGQIPAQGFVPVGFADHNGADFSTVAGDYGTVTDDSLFDEAVVLFAQAAGELGMTVEALRTALGGMVYLYNTSSGHQLVGEMLQAYWADNLGFTIQLQNQEWAVFQESRQNGEYDIARGGWLTDYMDPSGMLAIFTEGNAYNDPNYVSEAFDTLIAEAMSATTSALHFEKLYDAQEVLMADMPVIPIYYYADILMVQSYVKGWTRSVLGTIDLTHAYIEGK